MTNIKLYDDIFTSNFMVDQSDLGADFTIENVDNWDSLAHMKLVSSLEEAFNIMLDAEDIIELSSYENGMSLLGKYGIDF